MVSIGHDRWVVIFDFGYRCVYSGDFEFTPEWDITYNISVHRYINATAHTINMLS